MLTQILQTGNSSADFYGFLSSVLTLERDPARAGSPLWELRGENTVVAVWHFQIKTETQPKVRSGQYFCSWACFWYQSPGPADTVPRADSALYLIINYSVSTSSMQSQPTGGPAGRGYSHNTRQSDVLVWIVKIFRAETAGRLTSG